LRSGEICCFSTFSQCYFGHRTYSGYQIDFSSFNVSLAEKHFDDLPTIIAHCYLQNCKLCFFERCHSLSLYWSNTRRRRGNRDRWANNNSRDRRVKHLIFLCCACHCYKTGEVVGTWLISSFLSLVSDCFMFLPIRYLIQSAVVIRWVG